MKANKPTPNGTVQVTVKDMDKNTTKTKTFYDTTPEEVIGILEAAAEDAEPRPKGKK